tara:strand:- start:240 stop:671 length:432 start_codon:yes stop_codon:yes gene_type:complete
MLLLFRRGTRELQVIRPLLASAGLTFLSASDIRNGDGELTQVSNVRKEGLYVQTVAPVTGVVTGETGPTTNTVRISTNLVKPNNSAVALSDFDNGFAFGNDVSLALHIVLSDNSEIIPAYVCCPENQTMNDTLFETVRAIVEQ